MIYVLMERLSRLSAISTASAAYSVNAIATNKSVQDTPKQIPYLTAFTQLAEQWSVKYEQDQTVRGTGAVYVALLIWDVRGPNCD